MVLDKIRLLCVQNQTDLAKLERALGFGNGTIRRWSESSPSADKLKKVADYFHVSIDELLERDVPKNSSEATEIAQIFDSLPKDKQDLIRCYVSVVRSS